MILFLTLVESKNLSQAAEQLRTSQPRLSQQLARLEKDLGAELFERTSRGLRLSVAGEALLPAAMNITHAYKEAFSTLERLADKPRRELRLGVVPNTSVECLTRLLEILNTTKPEIRLTVTHATLPTLVKQIQSGCLDACLCFEPDDCGSLSWRPMFSTRLIGVSAAGSTFREEQTLSEFCKAPLALLTRHCGTRSALDRAFKKIGILPQVNLETDDPVSLVSLVKRGKVATILPDWQVAPSRLLRRTSLTSPAITVVRGLLHNAKADCAVRALASACAQCEHCNAPASFAT